MIRSTIDVRGLEGHHQPLNSTSISAILASGAIFTMTVSVSIFHKDLSVCVADRYSVIQGHAQDFRDRSGDAAIGRKTLPLILPQSFARWTLLMLIMSFTYGLISLWSPPFLASAVFSALGLLCSVKFVMNHSEEEDRKSFRWYEVRCIPLMH